MSQSLNLAFTQEIFELITRGLYGMRKKFNDGINVVPLRGKPYDVFDYEAVIKNQGVCELRCNNLIRFCQEIVSNMILKNLDPKVREKNAADCKYIFTSEILTLILKARQLILKKIAPECLEKEDSNPEKEDTANKYALRILFEDLIFRLTQIKPEDIIQIIGLQAYQSSPIMDVSKKRNNFYFLGMALNSLLAGQPVHFKIETLDPLK